MHEGNMKKLEAKQKEQFDMHFKLFQPWSTFVIATKLPPLILEKMLKITNEIVTNGKSEEKVDWEKSGSAQMEDEFSVKLKILERENVMEFFLFAVRHFTIQQKLQANPLAPMVSNILNDEWYTQMKGMWIISQKDNEYQPVHTHLIAPLAAVMYLKIPEYLPSRNPTRNEDGAITFINNCGRDNRWANPSITFQPEVGDLFIFSGSLEHLVYPFRTPDGKGERRSVSFNAEFACKSEQDFLKKQLKNQETI